jgi:hypothetical protein
MAAPWRRHKGISSVPKKRCATTWGKVGWGAGQLNNSNRCDLSIFIEGSLEVKLPTRGPYRKAEVGRVREEQGRSKKIREEKESEERRCGCAKR